MQLTPEQQEAEWTHTVERSLPLGQAGALRDTWTHWNGATVMARGAEFWWDTNAGGDNYCGFAATLEGAKSRAVPRCPCCGEALYRMRKPPPAG